MPAPFLRQPAPTLDLPLVGGGRVGLAATTPHQFALVVAYRGVHCPQCRRQPSELDSRLGGLRDFGVDKVVAVSGDDQAGRAGRPRVGAQAAAGRLRHGRGDDARLGPVCQHGPDRQRAGPFSASRGCSWYGPTAASTPLTCSPRRSPGPASTPC